MYMGVPSAEPLERQRGVVRRVDPARGVLASTGPTARASPKSTTRAPPVDADEHVGRLEVAVDEPAACAAASPRPAARHVCKTSVHGCTDSREPGAQLDALDVLHDDVHPFARRLLAERPGGAAVVGADVVHRDDVGMRHARERLRLAYEPSGASSAGTARAAHQLDRDDAIELRIARCVYDAQTTGTDLALELVAADANACSGLPKSACLIVSRALSSSIPPPRSSTSDQPGGGSTGAVCDPGVDRDALTSPIVPRLRIVETGQRQLPSLPGPTRLGATTLAGRTRGPANAHAAEAVRRGALVGDVFVPIDAGGRGLEPPRLLVEPSDRRELVVVAELRPLDRASHDANRLVVDGERHRERVAVLAAVRAARSAPDR